MPQRWQNTPPAVRHSGDERDVCDTDEVERTTDEVERTTTNVTSTATATRSTRSFYLAQRTHSFSIGEFEIHKTDERLRSHAARVFPLRVVVPSFIAACVFTVAVQAACDFLTGSAQRRQFPPEDSLAWPETWCDFRARQTTGEFLLHEGILFLAMFSRGLVMVIPSIIARRHEHLISPFQLAGILGSILFCSLLTNTMNIVIVTTERGTFQDVIKIAKYVPENILAPALYTWMLFRRDSIRSRVTSAAFVATCVLKFVGVFFTVQFGIKSATVVCIIFAMLLLAGMQCWLWKHPLPKEGRFDLSSQMLLGFWNSNLPLLINVAFVYVNKLGPSVIVAIWIGLCFIMRTLLGNLVNTAVPTGWRTQAFFPFLFLEDFMPVYLFASSDPLSVEFCVTAGALIFWEVVRDSPPLKWYLFSYLCPRCKMCEGVKSMRVWCAGVATILVSIFGGSVGAEVVEDVVQEGGEEVGVSRDLENTDLLMRIDRARHNMIGELISIALMLTSTVTTLLAGDIQFFAVENILICLGLEIAKIVVCTIINARALLRLGETLPDIAQSRFVIFNMVLIMVFMISMTLFFMYSYGIRANLRTACGW